MLVSILIPCYNAERWIAQAIESALGQTWSNKEVIVVDDGSTDQSLDVIKGYGDRVRWESGPNRGGNAARNHLLELSGGEWLQFLDADDYLLPEKIERQLGFISASPEVDVVFGPVTMEYVDEVAARRELLPIPEPHDPWILLARWHLPQTGATLWCKQALIDVGGWKHDQTCCQEHELYLRLLIAGKCFRYCPADGAVYRQWGEHTVCKRDRPEVHRQRLAIEQREEDFLLGENELSRERQWAINQARFETARSTWQYDRRGAEQIVALIHRTERSFIPAGSAAPLLYRTVYRLLGFAAAERIGASRRRIRRRPQM